MKNYYELLLALVVNGQEEDMKALLERLEKIINAEGGVVDQVQRLDRKEFAYPHNHLKAAHYVNIVMTVDPSAVSKIRQKLALIEEVSLQNYLRKGTVTTVTPTAKAKPARKKAVVAA